MYVYKILIWVCELFYSLICGSRKSKHFSQNTMQCQYLMVSEQFY